MEGIAALITAIGALAAAMVSIYNALKLARVEREAKHIKEAIKPEILAPALAEVLAKKSLLWRK